MVNRIFPNSSDFENLSRLRTEISPEVDNFDYSRVVVQKPWGYEYLWFQNTSVAVWLLHLRGGSATSLHCHAQKRTSLVVLKGAVLCSSIDSRFRLQPGDAIVLEPCVFHSSRAISPEGAFIMEVESPPFKTDLVRFRDDFGRTGKGYEDASQYSTDLTKFDHRPLSALNQGGRAFDFLDQRIQLVACHRAEHLKEKLMPGGLIVPFLGRLIFERELIADIGEAINLQDINMDHCPSVFAPVELLQVAPPPSAQT